MKKQTMLAVSAGIVLCATAFWLGRLSVSRNVITYSVNGWPTSVNRAWPTYGLFLAEDQGLLTMLRGGDSTNATARLEAMLDMTIYDAEHRRLLLDERELETLDKALVRVAKYREQFPRAVDTSTTGAVWIAEQKEIDAFLQNFAGR